MSERLDVALVGRGLVPSRTKAKRLIESAGVLVNGRPVTSVSTRVTESDRVEVTVPDSDVGRGAVKLRAALTAFPVPVEGCIAADIGASTGGFTQALLEAGATRVVALDVGHGQLDPRLLGDPRVINREGVHAAHLSSVWWQENGLPTPVSVVVVDVSFISVLKIVEPLVETFGVHSHYVFLVKPQFEVGRAGIDRGVVKDVRMREEALERVVTLLGDRGLVVHGVIDSPIAGESGNVEYLVHAGGDPQGFSDRIGESGVMPDAKPRDGRSVE